MRLVLALALCACSNTMPPPITDTDGGPQLADASPLVVISDDAGTASAYVDFAGTCSTSGYVPIWHFFDFQTHTPGTSSLRFSAQSADTESALASAPSVVLATVTGPDITSWTGVDVEPKLESTGQQSHFYLRVTVVATASGDGTQPVLNDLRQQYDCVVGQ